MPISSVKVLIGKVPSRRSRQTESSPLRWVRNTVSPVASAMRVSAGWQISRRLKRGAAVSPSSNAIGPRK